MKLFDRRYALTVDTIRTTELDVRFKVEKSLKKALNTAEITVFNLSQDHRDQLGGLDRIGVRLEAGYADEVGMIFAGDLRTVSSERDGADWLTKISGDDGGLAVREARINRSFGAGTTVAAVVESAARALGVGIGNALTVLRNGDLEGAGRVFTEGVVMSGPAADELSGIIESTGHEWSIQNGALQVLPRGGALQNPAYNLTSASGLIGSPTVARKKRGAQRTLTAKTLLIPALAPGQPILVDSDSVRGLFRIDKVVFTGDLSGQDWGCEIEAKVPT